MGDREEDKIKKTEEKEEENESENKDKEECKDEEKEGEEDYVEDVSLLFPPPEYEEEEYHFAGGTQRVLALPRQFGQIVIGEIVWRGATVLCEWLEGRVSCGGEPPFAVAGSRVAELGAGCGLCGLVCAQLGAARVLLTDYEPHVLALLARNAARNGLDAAAAVRALDWLRPLPPDLAGAFTAVVGSDVVYCRALCPGLFAAAAHLLAPGGVFAMVNGRARFAKAADLARTAAADAGLRLVSETAVDGGWQILSKYIRV